LVGVHVATALIHKIVFYSPTHAQRVAVTPFSIAILGNDAFLAASPALPVQLMHAALAAGFDAVVPASLGDELVAGETLRLAQLRGRRPVVQCACPFALAQLCKREANLADVTIAVAPAAVALARALRLERSEPQHITYIGACPGAQDPAIDLQVLPDAFLRGLELRGISVTAQPDVFSDRLPPDRRRFLSTPGGAPRPDLVEAVLRRNVVALQGRMNPLLAVADALFDGGVTMIDPAGAYHCACAGGTDARSVADGRRAIEQLEPARAASPIFEAPVWLDLRPTEPATSGDAATVAAPTPDPVAFADAARVDGAPRPLDASSDGRTSARSVASGGANAPDAAAPRGQSSATDADATQPTAGTPVPPSWPSLHARPIEREVPMQDGRERFADFLADAPSPPPLRGPRVDELFRRD
jgi:hypothetical protein